MKKVFALILTMTFVFTLAGCWAGEVTVETTFEKDGSGTRTIVLAVMDDTLSDTPITNPDDPEGVEGKGAVINDKHITGGIPEIYTWLNNNAPTWITVSEMQTDGFTRLFKLTYSFSDFEDFLAKYKELVNLSPNLDWDNFTAEEVPSFECSGLFTKECTFTESADLVNASLDWAVTGIFNDIYDESDLAGYVTKDDISVLAGYTVTINGEKVEDAAFFDENAPDGDYTGKVVYPEGPWTVTGEFANAIAYTVTGISVLAVAALAVVVIKKK